MGSSKLAGSLRDVTGTASSLWYVTIVAGRQLKKCNKPSRQVVGSTK